MFLLKYFMESIAGTSTQKSLSALDDFLEKLDRTEAKLLLNECYGDIPIRKLINISQKMQPIHRKDVVNAFLGDRTYRIEGLAAYYKPSFLLQMRSECVDYFESQRIFEAVEGQVTPKYRGLFY